MGGRGDKEIKRRRNCLASYNWNTDQHGSHGCTQMKIKNPWESVSSVCIRVLFVPVLGRACGSYKEIMKCTSQND